MASTEEYVNLKDIELKWDTAVKIIIHFIQKAQHKSSYKLQEAGILYKAVNFFNGEEKEFTEEQAVKIIISGLHVGQANGAFTLEEAGILHNRFLPFLNSELKKRQEEKN